MKTKYFRLDESTLISVTIRKETVNVGATCDMTPLQFAKLAVSVLAEHNREYGKWQGFPVADDLIDYPAQGDDDDDETNDNN